MDLESYLMGVVAGEMHNDWPIEALKAQAIVDCCQSEENVE